MPWKMVEYVCDDGHRFEELVDGEPTQLRACKRCGVPAELAISAPIYQHLTGKNSVSVTRGKPEEPPPGAMTTCPPRWK